MQRHWHWHLGRTILTHELQIVSLLAQLIEPKWLHYGGEYQLSILMFVAATGSPLWDTKEGMKAFHCNQRISFW